MNFSNIKSLLSIIIFFLILNLSGFCQGIDTAYVSHFDQNVTNIDITPKDIPFVTHNNEDGMFSVNNMNRLDTVKVFFPITALQSDSFALVVRIANIHNKFSTYYRVNEMINGKEATEQEWWPFNPSFGIGIGSHDSYSLIELQSSDTNSIGARRKLCHRQLSIHNNLIKSKSRWNAFDSKLINPTIDFNTFSFVKLDDEIYFFDRGYRHYFKLGYKEIPKGNVCHFDAIENISDFIITVAPGANVFIDYVLVTVP